MITIFWLFILHFLFKLIMISWAIRNCRILITIRKQFSINKMDPEKPKKLPKQNQPPKKGQASKNPIQQFDFTSNMFSQNHFNFYDIAANLTDHQFTGDYYGKKHHEDDRHQVI